MIIAAAAEIGGIRQKATAGYLRSVVLTAEETAEVLAAGQKTELAKAEETYRMPSSWVKVKCSPQQFSASSGAGLALSCWGHYQGGFLVYNGRAGTGFTHRMSIELKQMLKPLTIKKLNLHNVSREHGIRAACVKLAAGCSAKGGHGCASRFGHAKLSSAQVRI
ncbi:MAG: hypothetical protein E6Q98_20210 [Rhodospirillaceae bacterium]|nr:MAG: hypothetical protein E6Q98_20210 [Rhodospirillaceae bacterium]